MAYDSFVIWGTRTPAVHSYHTRSDMAPECVVTVCSYGLGVAPRAPSMELTTAAICEVLDVRWRYYTILM